MNKEQQHSLNISNSNAQRQGSQTLSLGEQELSRYLWAPRARAASSTPLFLLRETRGWGLGGKPVPASSGALCGLTVSALPIPRDPQGTI